ncbi:MAG: OFA family MFS transporter [Gammaproteobacteria bacterium]|nr:OFA family MFS transporter [Gammaproteobacteria bacterium]
MASADNLSFSISRIGRGMLCILLHLCFGTVYAWSFFQVLLVDHLDWSFTDTSISFGLTIFSLGLSAAWAGMMLPKLGPRKLAVAGSVLFCSGYFIASWALQNDNLAMFLFGYGFVGGTGLGFGYVVPVATVANWFPEHKGLSTGLVVMGFGLGALFLSKLLAPALLVHTEENLPQVFLLLGVLFSCILLPSSLFVTNPPRVEATRMTPLEQASAPATEEDRPDYVRKCVSSYEFIIMWLIFFFNIAAGISVISFQSPLLQDVWKLTDATVEPEVLAIYGANLIAVSSVCNGVGRLLWGLLSDHIGRVMVFRILLASQTVVFGILMTERDPWIFSALVCYIMLCFGGGFATMPSFVLDVFGQKKMSTLYGLILTAWSFAGIIGPLYVGYLKDNYPNRVVIYCFLIGVLFLSLGFIFSMLLSNERIRLSKPTMESTLGRFQIPLPRAQKH